MVHGHAVQNAVYVPRGARLAVVGPQWAIDDRTPSYPGFSGYGTPGGQFLADSARTALAITRWLTGKTTGAALLVLSDDAVGRMYGPEWRTVMTGAGHTITVTGSLSSWAGYEPLDFDLTCMANTLAAFSYHGLATAQEKVDYVLENGGNILGHNPSGQATVWAAYGIDKGAKSHATTFAGADHGYHVHYVTDGPEADNDGWVAQTPFACAAFGDPGAGGSWGTHYYAFTCPTTTPVLAESTNTRGGTRTLYDCACAQDKNPYRSHYTGDGQITVLGLWQA